MLRGLVVAFAFLVILAPVSRADEETPVERTVKIVLIGHKLDHPFRSHMYLHECRLLAKCLEQTPGVTAVVSDGWPQDSKTMQDVDAIVFYSSPAANIMLEGRPRQQAEKLLAGGAGYTAIHWATGARGEELGETYLRVLGGWFDRSFGGLDVSRQRLVQVDPQHPVCRGWQEYDIRDEYYLKTRLMPESRPILSVNVDDQKQVVAWAYDRPDSSNGRSFGITLGHFHDNFGIEAFRRAIVNGILWTAHVEVPNTGAPVTISAADMELGEDPRK